MSTRTFPIRLDLATIERADELAAQTLPPASRHAVIRTAVELGLEALAEQRRERARELVKGR